MITVCNFFSKITIGLVIAASIAGCIDSPSRIDLPNYDAAAGRAAIAAYDTNKDGRISGDELRQSPELLSALAQVDSNKDQAITAEEIDGRVRQWRDSQVGRMPVACKVVLNGTPLADAQVVFDPVPFLGPAVKPASGTTGIDGTAVMSLAEANLDDPNYPGVSCGWYTIRVTSKIHTIPDNFNTNSTLGCEVASDAVWASKGLQVSLKTKPSPERAGKENE
ncbi:MAG: hypothetical protein ACRC7O_10505 [Fimbriiglobus sp.]